ncbi:hypothetical protein Cfor_04311 [Coptotermes formosanus]|uniref:FAS1 domain-containing protein n=1 Tax=Coptotermes formosanus TaxID=36987 RepID=A0A6L2PLW0_COPFO|nr:hypothetical protein Cfor_04311 [Coptotermes formosanus]
MDQQRRINDRNQLGFIWPNLLSEDYANLSELNFTRKHGQPVDALTTSREADGGDSTTTESTKHLEAEVPSFLNVLTQNHATSAEKNRSLRQEKSSRIQSNRPGFEPVYVSKTNPEGHGYISELRPSSDKRSCGWATNHKLKVRCPMQSSMIRYECCEGYQQVPGQQGCAGVKRLKNVLDTARDLGAGKFVTYLEQSGLDSDLLKEGTYTLFAPLDDAFDDLAAEQRSRLETDRRRPQNPLLLYHLADRKLTSQHFRADLLVDTRYTGHKLRINKYSNGIETVNCAFIVRKDQEATNGIVHVVDSVLDPASTAPRDLAELVLQDGRFSELAKAMEQSGFVTRLRNSQQPCTILAPSDEAFQKIPQSRLERILNDKHAREALLEHHVIPHPICLPAIIGEHKVRSLGSEKLTFNCDKKGTTVEEKRLRSDFVMGQNGVLYMLDDVLLPDRAKSIVQLAEQAQLFVFLQLVRSAGLEEAFENFGEYTVFAPSESAMYALPPNQLQELKTNKDKARSFVLYHATQGRITSDQISDNQVVMSLDEQNPLRLQVYRKAIGVEDALIEKADLQGMNGNIHIINKALSPSNISAGDILRRDGNFSIFLQAIERVTANNPESLELQSPGASYTFFVPTDQAFNRLGAARLERIMEDPAYLTKVSPLHSSIPTAHITAPILNGMRTNNLDQGVVTLHPFVQNFHPRKYQTHLKQSSSTKDVYQNLSTNVTFSLFV